MNFNEIKLFKKMKNDNLWIVYERKTYFYYFLENYSILINFEFFLKNIFFLALILCIKLNIFSRLWNSFVFLNISKVSIIVRKYILQNKSLCSCKKVESWEKLDTFLMYFQLSSYYILIFTSNAIFFIVEHQFPAVEAHEKYTFYN